MHFSRRSETEDVMNERGDMDMIDLDDVMAHLAFQRPVFHSEADFQHAFAWEIHRQLPDASIRLELPHALPDRPIHLDVSIRRGDAVLAVELKYATRAFVMQAGGEDFALKNHSAQDERRHDFIKDIERVERIIAGQTTASGFAILLTNDSLFWRQGRDGSVDAAFQIWEGRDLHGTLGWGAMAGSGTTKGRASPRVLAGRYRLKWRDYSHPAPINGGEFRYLAVRVGPQELNLITPRSTAGPTAIPAHRPHALPIANTVTKKLKYGALTALLGKNHADCVTLRFAEVAECVGGLPKSAQEYREWWANHAANPQARGWLDAGFMVETLDTSGQCVTFVRVTSR